MVVRHRFVIVGGLGSGKSTVGRLFGELGWDVIDTDQIGHFVLRDERIVAKVGERWPGAIANGSVDRAVLARIVFGQPGELAALEALTHPAIAAKVRSWLSGAGKRSVVEVSVLKVVSPEWGKVVLVTAPLGIRVERAIARGMDPNDVHLRIKRQQQDQEYVKRADFVIDNSGSEESLASAVRELDRWTTS